MVPTANARMQRFLLVGGVTAYIACFQWVYIRYLSPEWAYFGFEYHEPGTKYMLLGWLLALLPSIWMPVQLNRPSYLMYWVLYITVLIPSMFVPFYAGFDRPNEISGLVITLFAGFAIVGCSYALPLRSIRPQLLSGALFWVAVGTLTFCLTSWLIVVFRHHLQLVSFNDIYYLRDAANDVSDNNKVNFAFMLSTGAIYPFLIACGLHYRKKVLLLAGMLGQLLIYSIGGTKGAILSIAFLPGTYLLLKFTRISFGLNFLYSSLIVLGGAAFSYELSRGNPGPIQAIICFVVLLRTLAMNGLVTAQYFDFFQKNPVTHYSHVTGVNWYVHYPYSNPIGMEIGLAYQGTTGLDQTGHFWAMDGIAALGLPGILLTSILCAAVFWLLDSVSQGHDPKLAALVTTYAAYNLANIPLFTSLWSGGLGVLMLLLYWMPRQQAEYRRHETLLAKLALA
jgi:hypothetical protein